MKLVGIAGTNGSGKDTVGHMLAERHGFLFVSMTDMLREELKRRGLPLARQYTRQLSAEWRRENGLGVLVDKAVGVFKAQGEKKEGLVCASLRNPGEADRVHELGGKVVWVDADPKVRYDRIQASQRGEHRKLDDQKTFEQFMAEEEVEMYHPAGGDEATLSGSAVKAKADIFITNDGDDIEAFKAKAEKALGRKAVG